MARGRKATQGTALTAAERKRLSRERLRSGRNSPAEFRDTSACHEIPPCHEIETVSVVIPSPVSAPFEAFSASAPVSEFRDILTCSASTTASNSHRRENSTDFDPLFTSVCCDWMSGRHEYLEEVEPRFGGHILKVSKDGEVEWESGSWESIRCPSSDTSIRAKCDGKRLWFSANIGRFQQADNFEGLTVIQCVERWAKVLKDLGFDTRGFGTRHRVGTPAECGTFLTRIDLAGNLETDNYAALCTASMSRRIGQRLPKEGKYGPTWGYDAKRGNWMKAKLYDKSAELAGRRTPSPGATIARFEVQLGGEFLKQNHLDSVAHWRGDEMGQIIYGRFADQVFRDQIDVTQWSDIPLRLRGYAVLWRDGEDIRNHVSQATYYRIRKQLLEGFGIDIGVRCNVQSLTRRVQTVTVTPINALRRVA